MIVPNSNTPVQRRQDNKDSDRIVNDDDDSGFFPMEFFDDVEVDPVAPEILVQYAASRSSVGDGICHGHSKWFDTNGRWEWRACRALEYDAATSRYLIEWEDQKYGKYLPSGHTKYVTRLNLKLAIDSDEKFARRISNALVNRRRAEAILVRCVV